MAEPVPSTTNPRQLPADSVPLAHVRSRLAVVWLASAALIFGLLILQSLLGKYGNRAQQVWSWVLPTMMPTLTLMLSALGADALNAEPAGSYLKKSFFQIAFWLSLAYLFLILLTILIEPFVATESLDLFNLSNLWLGPLQGLVASTIGLLFLSKRSAAGPNQHPDS